VGIVAALTALVVGILVGAFYGLKKDLPSPAALFSYQPPIATKVLDCEGNPAFDFFSERRDPVSLDTIPKYLVDGFVAVEDKRFYRHWGLDLVRIGGATVANLTHRRVVQGGSTITQQLARNMFLTQELSLIRKLKEAVLAIELERYYSKREILEMYLNQVYFGAGAYGVEAASQTYFRKHVWELNLPECTLIAALARAPEIYSPYRSPEACLKRRNLFLKKLLENKAITPLQWTRASRAPLGLAPKPRQKNDAPYFIEEVRRYLETKYGSDFLYKSGSVIYTTLDLNLQRKATEAITEGLLKIEEEENLPKKQDFDLRVKKDTTLHPDYLQAALVLMDARTGAVRALVGGRDFNQSSFDRATEALRQPGSAFKVFVYTAAIDNGLTPADIELDAPVVIPIPGAGNYVPSNYDRTFLGPMSLRTGLALSRNMVAVRLTRNLGPELVVQYASRMGIKERLLPVMSLGLGACEVDLLSLTAAYAVLAHEGKRVEPVFITKIVSREGKVIEERKSKEDQVLAPATAYVTVDMLRSVVDAGTARIIRSMGFSQPAAGKTGTTDDYTDAWFVGFTPSLSCGVWVGYDKKKTIFRGAQGGRLAAPIWADMMKYATEGKPAENFVIPPGIVYAKVCNETGLLATPYCPQTHVEVFVQGTEPKTECELHKYLSIKKGLGPAFEALDRKTLKGGI
jgi:penicillin-binding protein 1A